MAGYIETYRGDVASGEIDAIEAVTHYKAELRNRDIYRIETATIKSGKLPVIGHKLFNHETGLLCTTMQQTLDGVVLSEPEIEWDGDVKQFRSIPDDSKVWIPSLRNIARPDEMDWAGNLSLAGYIHRFSTANCFILSAMGITPTYLTNKRIGMSTFEFQLVFHEQAKAGDMIDIESCIAHIGGSSLRFYHRMRNAKSGVYIAGLSQFGVHLDLDARRPSRIPEEFRIQAHTLNQKQ